MKTLPAIKRQINLQPGWSFLPICVVPHKNNHDIYNGKELSFLVRSWRRKGIRIMPTRIIDVTKDMRVADFIRQLSPIRQPIQIMLGGQAVARLVPAGELTEVERENILQEGWKAVQQARARNKGSSEREIGKAVDAAVRRVRTEQ